jgi:hypothetical protein
MSHEKRAERTLNDPAVSVLIINYNSGPHLAHTLRALAARKAFQPSRSYASTTIRATTPSRMRKLPSQATRGSDFQDAPQT